MSTTSTSAQVPKLRFPGFEDPWQRKTLGAVGEFKNGLNKGKEDFGFGHPFVNLMDVFGRSTLSSASFGLVNATDADLQAYDLTAGDVLFIRSSVKREGVGEAILVAEDLPNTVYSGFLIRFREHGSTLAPGFKRHGFGVPQFRQQVLSLATTSANTNINQDSLEQIEVSYPTKAEQQKIAAFLTAVDGRIEQLSRKKALLEAYKKGVMQQLFTQTLRFQDDQGHDFPDWEEKRFYELLDAVLDFRGRTPLKLGMEWGGGEIISLSANNVKNGRIDLSAECNLASEALYERWMGEVDLQKGDIVFTMEAPLGQALLIPDNQKYILSQRVVAFKTKRRVHNPFLLQLIWSEGFQSQLTTLATGSTAKGINQKSLQKVMVRLPSLPEQTKIAGFLSALDGKIGAVGEQMRQTQAWKKGLLQQMFV